MARRAAGARRLGQGGGEKSSDSIPREAQVRAKRMSFWREMAEAGGASTAMTMENRHDPHACVAIQMFGCDYGCRRHTGE